MPKERRASINPGGNRKNHGNYPKKFEEINKKLKKFF
jgi:hypothetical protein